MPGPVSDSYDPEWGTSANRKEIAEALCSVYNTVSVILRNKPPMYILKLLEAELGSVSRADLTEKQWRLIRFAIERAIMSL